MRGWNTRHLVALPALALSACGGGSGGQVQSTPAPVAAPPATPVSTPASSGVDFNTAEYRASSGPSFHGAITAYETGASGAGITVGIVDSGISDVGGEFTGRISPLSRDFGGNGSFVDVGGHGTAVAETLAGARNDKYVQGMAWGATIMALRTDKPGSCAGAGCEHTSTAMAQAIDYAWRNGARVINLSLGGDINSSDLLAAVGRATSAGTIIVVAAGNGNSASPDQLAASIANPRYSNGLVIIATSVGSDGIASSFSNGARGYEAASLAALGDAVRTMDHRGADLLYTGTSFSAPQIAGAAALLAQAFPNLTGKQIVQLLLTTARDAGAAGADSVYGMGILDVGSAFRPQGQLSFAGSAVALGSSEPTLLSTAMGDASPAGLGAVVLDSYRRPFRTDLAAGMQRPGARSLFTAALAGTSRQLRGAAGPLSLAFNVAPGRSMPLSLRGDDEGRARFLSGMIEARMTGDATLALGLRTGLLSLTQSLANTPRPAFLMADQGAAGSARELRSESSLAWKQGIAGGLALVSGMETGTAESPARRPGLGFDNGLRETARFDAVMTGLAYEQGRIGVTTTVRMVHEQGSVLGARFAPALGAQSARSLFAAIDLHAQPLPGLTLAAAMQRGWTYAASGGALNEGGLLKTRSWSLDLMGANVLAPGDLIGLRIAAPLRVTASRFMLDLPQSWDWQSETATIASTALNLVPGGSERDYELSYGIGIGRGWLGANLFMRTQAGHIAAMPDDAGAALRWSVGF